MQPHLKKMHPALTCITHLKMLVFKRKSLFIFLFCYLGFATEMIAQQQTVRGKITDERSSPLDGASVKVSGSRTGVTTDANGNFTIKAAKGQVLVISYIGMADE